MKELSYIFFIFGSLKLHFMLCDESIQWELLNGMGQILKYINKQKLNKNSMVIEALILLCVDNFFGEKRILQACITAVIMIQKIK